MEQLQMTNMIQVICVEGKHDPTGYGSHSVLGEVADEEKHDISVEKISEQEYEVIREDGISGNKIDRKRKQSLGEEMFGVGQGVGIGIKYIGLEEMGRIRKKLVPHMRKDPGV
jgi:hypothetical protein